jgi:hypothetical protein
MLMFYVLGKAPPGDSRFGIVASCLFYLLYLVPYALFDAKVKVLQAGLEVRQFRSDTVGYSEIVKCISLFLVPLQITIIITRRPFPLCIVVTGDQLEGRRRSMVQDGLIAASIKGRMGLMR